MRVVILVSGLLLGAACSEDIIAMAGAASDAVEDVYAAPEVTIDTSTAEALAELALLVEANSQRLDALALADEEAAAVLQEARADIFDMKTGNIALKQDLEKVVGEQELLNASFETIATTVQELHVAVEDLQLAIVDDTCPSQMTAAGDLCVDTVAKVPDLLGAAHQECVNAGAHLCTLWELVVACEAGVKPTAEDSWTATQFPEGIAVTKMAGCNPAVYNTSPYGGVTRPYRCCAAR